jgi:hypothetical protein
VIVAGTILMVALTVSAIPARSIHTCHTAKCVKNTFARNGEKKMNPEIDKLAAERKKIISDWLADPQEEPAIITDKARRLSDKISAIFKKCKEIRHGKTKNDCN